jgi:hydrogenase maturation protease
VTDPVRTIADAVLYEGYLLWPYRGTALKNQRRWTFGGVYPEAHSRAHPDDRSLMRTECVLDGATADDVDVTVRFLQVVQVGEREEAIERELGPGAFEIPASDSWEALSGAIDVHGDGNRIVVEITNRTPWAGGSREDALRRTFCSTHTILRTRRGRFVSATEAAGCENIGTWPVLIGDDTTMLSSPIILEDHPQIAPESPGDLYDGGEIDGLLTLSIMSLTDAEKEEIRAGDPRARAILERTESLTEEQLLRLHGFRMSR